MRVCFLVQDVGDVYGAERTTLDVVAALRAGSDPVDARVLMIEETRLGLERSRYRDAMESQSIPYEVVVTSRRFSRALVGNIVELLRRERVDVLHCVGPKANVHGWLAARKLPAVSAVTSVHGWLARPGWKEKVYDRVEKTLLKRFAAVIVLSRHYETWIRTLAVPENRVVRISVGFDTDAWPGRTDVGSAVERPFTVGMMARLSPEKNHRLLLDAASRMREQGTAFRVILAGEGPHRARLEQWIGQTGLGDCVELSGYMDPQAFYRKIDVAVLCSRLENLPYSMMEAMACEIPCVVTRAGGLPELVDDGETGFVVEPGHVNDLADRLGRLAADPALARKQGRAGREKLQREFSVARQVDAHRKLYASLVIP